MPSNLNPRSSSLKYSKTEIDEKFKPVNLVRNFSHPNTRSGSSFLSSREKRNHKGANNSNSSANPIYVVLDDSVHAKMKRKQNSAQNNSYKADCNDINNSMVPELFNFDINQTSLLSNLAASTAPTTQKSNKRLDSQHLPKDTLVLPLSSFSSSNATSDHTPNPEYSSYSKIPATKQLSILDEFLQTVDKLSLLLETKMADINKRLVQSQLHIEGLGKNLVLSTDLFQANKSAAAKSKSSSTSKSILETSKSKNVNKTKPDVKSLTNSKPKMDVPGTTSEEVTSTQKTEPQQVSGTTFSTFLNFSNLPSIMEDPDNGLGSHESVVDLSIPKTKPNTLN